MTLSHFWCLAVSLASVSWEFIVIYRPTLISLTSKFSLWRTMRVRRQFRVCCSRRERKTTERESEAGESWMNRRTLNGRKGRRRRMCLRAIVVCFSSEKLLPAAFLELMLFGSTRTLLWKLFRGCAGMLISFCPGTSKRISLALQVYCWFVSWIAIGDFQRIIRSELFTFHVSLCSDSRRCTWSLTFSCSISTPSSFWTSKHSTELSSDGSSHSSQS